MANDWSAPSRYSLTPYRNVALSVSKPIQQFGSNINKTFSGASGTTRATTTSRTSSGTKPSSLGYQSPSRAAAQAQGMRSTKASTAAAQQDQGMSMLDWLMSMAGTGGGSGGGRSGPSRGQIQAQGQAARSRMEALYKQYADMIAGRAADIGRNYETAATNLGGIYGGAEQNINAAYDAARAAQTAQLQALGLTEMAPPTNTQQQAYSATMMNRLKAAGLSENEAARVAAINNNLALQNAASAEGARALSSFDAQLANALASAGSGGGGGGGGGMSLRPSDLLSAARLDFEMQQAASRAARPQQTGPSPAEIDAIYQRAVQGGMSPSDAARYTGLFT